MNHQEENNQPILLSSKIVNVNFGVNVKVMEPANIYGCTIGDNSNIGPFVEIQKGVEIGKNCKIQSHAFICELVTVGDNCFISHGAMFVNDPFKVGGPAKGNRTLWRKTTIGNNVSIGTNATIMPVEICSNVVIGAGAVVTKNITEPGIYAGNPAKLIRKIE
jgi:acetyltransferase-like isoleucine patch superfamily enzyme